MEVKKIIKTALSQGFFTLISRISGLVRDVVFSAFLGASGVSDAFLIASKIPNATRKLIGEGATSPAFIPIFIKNKQEGEGVAKKFSAIIISIILIKTIVLTAICQFYVEDIVFAIAPGIKEDINNFYLAVKLTQITLPFIIFTCIGAILGGMLQSINVFSYFAAIPIILNIAIILGLLIGSDDKQKCIFASFGFVVGGFIQVMLLIYGLKKNNFLPSFFNKEKTKGLLRFFINLGPIILTQGFFQINMFISTIFASKEKGLISHLYYCDRLYQFAIAIIGHTLATISLPVLSQAIKEYKYKEALSLKTKYIYGGLFLSIPASFCLIAIAPLIVEVIFKRGHFTQDDVKIVANMLMILSLNIPFVIMNKIKYSAFYSFEKTKYPSFVVAFCLVLNVLLNFVLIDIIPIYYLSISSTTCSLVEYLLLHYGIKRKFNKHTAKEERIYLNKVDLLKMILISFIVACFCYLMYKMNFEINKILLTALIVLFGVIFYFTISAKFKIIDKEHVDKFLEKCKKIL